jgi:hypothetical protein
MERPIRLLLFTPWVPYPVTGACQQDRFSGIMQLKDMGYDLHVIGRIHAFQPKEEVEQVFAKAGIPLTLVPHTERIFSVLLRNLPRIVREPALLDGAALEYADPAFEREAFRVMDEFKPDVVWMDFTTHWPIMRLIQKRYNVPVIIKSTLIEPYSALVEGSFSVQSYLRFPAKYLGERIATKESDLLLPITHAEDTWYKAHGAKGTKVLPLRSLSKCFYQKKHEPKDVLDVVFLSSTYNMAHNRDALEFLLTKVVPLARERAPGQFRFNLTGKKFPERFQKYLAGDVRPAGFVEDLGVFLAGMDIALCPWVTGYGMQQKVFEPLCRSLPLITTQTAGYDFEPGKEVLLADTAERYVEHLLTLRDPAVRQAQADAAYAKSQLLFREDAVKRIMRDAIESVAPAR